MSNTIKRIFEQGQSIWCDNISRHMLDTGGLQRLIELGVVGVTSNPTIFMKAITGGNDYDELFRSLLAKGLDTLGTYEGLVLPDIATCPDCLRDILDADNRRYRYPFTNCTNCGPRFSIINALPYDRAYTSMSTFEMCPECRAEYEDPLDRRFHAQPNACSTCGPHVEFWNRSGRMNASRAAALTEAAEVIRAGEILALKGLGGFQFIFDARNHTAVRRLRGLGRRGRSRPGRRRRR